MNLEEYGVPPISALHAQYAALNKLLAKAKERDDTAALGMAVSRMLGDKDFAAWIAQDKRIPASISTPAECWLVAQRYLYRILYARDYAGAALLLWGPEVFDPRPRSCRLIFGALHKNALVNAMGGASSSKCLGRGTMVMMADGTTRPVEDIVAGDLLMGDDSTPRTVLSLARGREKLYEVIPSAGDPWVCNESHILSLKCAYDKLTRHGRPVKGRSKGDVRDIPLRDVLKQSGSDRRIWKQYRVGFELPKRPTPVDPYCYGAWLADGGLNLPVVHKPKGAMTDAWCQYWEWRGARIHEIKDERSTCSAWFVRYDGFNPCTEFVKTSTVDGVKRILPDYLLSSRSDRLQLLAGILDGDGFALQGHFTMSAKDVGFADDVTRLARSLGFYVSNTEITGTIKSIGFEGKYRMLYISGDVHLIPTKQKHPTLKKSTRDPMLQELTFRDLGEGDFFGFELDGNRRFLLGDCTVTHNTYSGVAYTLLDWLLDPEWTSILLVGPDSDHLRRNMFGDLVRLHEGSVIPLPGKADTESLSTDKRRGMGFFTVALDRGPAASAKLKGAKTKPRSGSDHQLFGRSSRLRILIDEAQQVPVNAWGMLINAISNKESDEHLKVYCAANPSDESSVYGKNCKPSGGWTAIDSVQETWMSETGWAVVRLNAMLSENVRSRKTIFPRLINYEKVMAIIRAAGGDDQAPEVYTQVYGMFPPTGSKAAVIKPTHVELSRGEWIFSGPTTSYMSFDPAYTGDRPAVAAGRYGMASAWMDYAGEIHKLKHEMPAIQVDSVGVLTRGDTQDMADEIFITAKSLGVAAECFGIDRTGIGQGCHDIIRRQWGKAVHGRNNPEPADILGICYSERASDTKVLDEDTDVPVNMYDNTASELWYAAGKLFERGVIRMGKGVDKLAFDELVGRRGGRVTGKARKLSVESKDAYKARGNSSPDFADTVTMLIHTIRVREDFAPKAEKTPEAREEVVDNWAPVNAWDSVGDVGGLGTVSVDMSRLLDNRD
mgnify:CR=1 FL=1